MADRRLDWRIEEACHNAWPAARQIWLGDWMLKFAPGVSRRANSANPLRAEAAGIDALVAAGTDLCRAQGQPLLVRVLSLLDPAVDRRLAALGFSAEGESCVLYAGLGEVVRGRDPAVETSSRPGAGWLSAMSAIREHSPDQAAMYRRIVDSIAVPAAFLCLRADGRLAALAFGVLHDRLLCCESVITASEFRGRGYSRRLMAAMFAWAEAAGAEGVCLQVEAANNPALALYRRLGLRSERFRYHYRRAPINPPP